MSKKKKEKKDAVFGVNLCNHDNNNGYTECISLDIACFCFLSFVKRSWMAVIGS